MAAAWQHRSRVLSLYRRCLRSAFRIKDGGHRETYLDYTRTGFRRHRHLPFDSIDVPRILLSAQEQLERMDYYHSIQQPGEDDKMNTENDSTGESCVSTEEQAPTAGVGVTADAARETQPGADSHGAAFGNSRHSVVVVEWLRRILPDLDPDDEATYVHRLLADGFDSEQLLSTLEDADLCFMKKAHRRAVCNALKASWSED